jgi:hypothetical protein
VEFNKKLQAKVLEIAETDYLYVPAHLLGREEGDQMVKDYCQQYQRLQHDVSF